MNEKDVRNAEDLKLTDAQLLTVDLHRAGTGSLIVASQLILTEIYRRAMRSVS